MPTPYKKLNDADVEQENGHKDTKLNDSSSDLDEQRAKAAHVLQMLLLSVFLLFFLGASLFQTPMPKQRRHELKEENFSYRRDDTKYDCNIQLVESIPIGLNYSDGSPKFLSTSAAWQQLLDSAKSSLDIGSFYWSLRGEDTGTNHSSTAQGEEIFNRLLANGNKDISSRIKIRIAQSEPSKVSPEMDTQLLAGMGAADVVSISFPKYFGSGVLHSKVWIVDNTHFYLGSANMDWRSLTQVKELGILAQNCPKLAADMSKIFEIYWCLGSVNPDHIPSWIEYKYQTNFNLNSPMILNFNKNATMEGFISSAPPPLSAAGRTQDLDAILDTINKAVLFVNIAVMDYFPLIIYEKRVKYWPYIDDALRRAAVDRGVTVRLLISWWKHSNPSEDKYLRSLLDLTSAKDNIDIQIRRFIVPSDADQESLPFTRVNHNKYMVTDRVAYIGTSNWSGDYFTDTAGISLTVSQTRDTETNHNLRSDLQSVFDRDWNSPYAHEFK